MPGVEDNQDDFNIDVPDDPPNQPIMTDEISKGNITVLKQSVENGSYNFSGRIDIDAILMGSRWNVPTVSYQFAALASDMSSWSNKRENGLIGFNESQRQAVHQILDLVSSYTLLNFSYDQDAGASGALLKFAQSTRGVDAAEARPPSLDIHSGEVWVRDFQSSLNIYYTNDPRLGNSGFSTFMHEIGHALGLKHGHQDYSDYDMRSIFGVDAPRRGSNKLPLSVDGQDWTLMTYTSAPSSSQIEYVRSDAVQSYMQFDIAALQYLYGANFASHSGDTTYRWDESTGEFFIDGQSQGIPTANKISMTIWDGDGIDTYDLSNYSSNLTVDLNPGIFSTFSAEQLIDHTDDKNVKVKAKGNIANALLYNDDRRSLIENVNGGSGSDTIIGNVTNNALNGGAGDDVIRGQDGDDTVFGSAGADQVYGEDGDDFVGSGAGNDFGSGGWGNDEVHGEAGNDLLFGDDGNDGVYGEDGDDLVYGGTGNDVLTGDAGIDRVRGEAGDDRLFGGEGGDDLSGGAGADTIEGGGGTDLLFGNAGDDILTGGAGADIFGFGRGDGRDVILDFVTGGSEADVIAFNGGVFADFAAVRAASQQEGADVTIAYGAGDALTLTGVSLGALSATSFTFA